jgi:hypothetical protein
MDMTTADLTARWARTAMAIGAAALVFTTWGCAAAPLERPLPTTRIDKGAGTLESTRKALEGTWKLQSLDVVQADGKTKRVKAGGTLTYDAFGGMVIRAAIEDPALSGTLVLDYSGRIVIDIVKSEFYPQDLESDRPADAAEIVPISPDKIRRFELNGDSLVVTTLDKASKPAAVIHWHRQA